MAEKNTGLFGWIVSLFSNAKSEAPRPFEARWSKTLESYCDFYRRLGLEDRRIFEQRVLLFLDTTAVVSNEFEVNDDDRLLVAASAIIPVWAFPRWDYFNLHTVILVTHGLVNDGSGHHGSGLITGMVGSGVMSGKMFLSRQALYQGFQNPTDARNVGIHEFVHLIDMADGECDGFPERLLEHAYTLPWMNVVAQKIKDIVNNESEINAYGATNNQEFLSVVSEYFFERPGVLQRKHPKLYGWLEQMYQLDMAAIAKDKSVRKKAPCPCGSGKRYKRCCMPRAD